MMIECKCPKCGSDNIESGTRPALDWYDGYIKCLDCEYEISQFGGEPYYMRERFNEPTNSREE